VAVVVGAATAVVLGASVVVAVAGDVVAVVDAGPVEDVLGATVVVVIVVDTSPGGALVQETRRETARTVVRRVKDTIRTCTTVSLSDCQKARAGKRQHSPTDERARQMLFASAVPLRPGKTDRYRDLATELRPHLEEYQGLNRRFEVGAHAYWINHGRESDIGVSVYDISSAGLARMRLREWDPSSAYDRWWLEFVEDVNGVDLLQGSAHVAPPEPVFDWSND
jgi:hypothetical protein